MIRRGGEARVRLAKDKETKGVYTGVVWRENDAGLSLRDWTYSTDLATTDRISVERFFPWTSIAWVDTEPVL